MDTTRTDNGSTRHMSRGRMAAWIAAGLLLLLPLVAMQFTREVNWTGADFVFAGILLFVPLGIYEVVVRKTGNPAYQAGVGVALVAAFLVIWVNSAVGIHDTAAADGLYTLVLTIGIVGAFVARFRPAGMARAMLAVALALVAVSGIALVGGAVAKHNSPFQIVGITGFFVTLFAGSALLFREAARGEEHRSAV